jgi:hypothetical protein
MRPGGEQPAFVLIGAVSHSSRFRAVFCEQMTFGHLAQAAHQILVAVGGTPRVWRTDRMATVVVPASNRLTVDAANIAKHYGVPVAVCPPRRAQRKGVVEAAVKFMTRSWWRSAAVTSPAQAQASLEAWSVEVADQRPRPDGMTVGELGAGEPLLTLPPLAYPALITVQRKASRSALVPFDGNRYSVPPAHAGRTVSIQTRDGEANIRVISTAGELLKAIPSRSEHVPGERLDRVQIPRDHRVEQPSLDEEINPVLRQQLIDGSVQHRHCGWRDRPEPAEIGEQVHQRPRCQERRIPCIPTRPTEPLHSCIVKRVDAEILGREPAAQMPDNP